MGRWTKRAFARAITCALATGPFAVAVAPAQAAIPNPATNMVPSAQSNSACAQAPTGLQCDIAVLGDINTARAAEGVGPMILPTNYESLSQIQQILVVTNLERTGRGLIPAGGLSASLDAIAASAAAANVDPDPKTIQGDALASNWAGGIDSPLLVDFYWMYDDGPGSPNIDCSSPSDPGCWVHRDNILYPFDAPLAFGAAELHQSGSATSVTELFVGGDQALAAGAVDALLGPSWNVISQSLQPLLSASSLSYSQTTSVQQVRVTASAQNIPISARTTQGWQVSPTSCQLASWTSCDLTITRTSATAGSGKLTISGPAGTNTIPLGTVAAVTSTAPPSPDTATSTNVTKVTAPVRHRARPRHHKRRHHR